MNGQLRKGAYSLALDVLRIGTGHIKFDLEVVVPAHSSRTGLAWRIRVLSLGVDESTDSPTKPLKKSQYTSVRQRGAGVSLTPVLSVRNAAQSIANDTFLKVILLRRSHGPFVRIERRINREATLFDSRIPDFLTEWYSTAGRLASTSTCVRAGLLAISSRFSTVCWRCCRTNEGKCAVCRVDAVDGIAGVVAGTFGTLALDGRGATVSTYSCCVG